MAKKAKQLLGYTITSALSIAAFAAGERYLRNRTEQQAGKHAEPESTPQPTFMWISADSLFEVGEEVRIQDPFTLEVKDVGTYVVIEKFHVKEDFSFYYRLENASTGEVIAEPYAEDWLIEAELGGGSTAESEVEQARKEAKVKAQQAESVRKFEIDYHLATLHDAKVAGDTKAYAEAEAELKRLTTEGADE